MSYLTLFLAALIAATVLPMQSEVVLAYQLTDPSLSVPLLLSVATFGNVLGSTVNWIAGRFLRQFQDRRWFPVKPAQLARAEAQYRRYGRWSLLLSWAPFIGDPLTVVAGVLREPLPSFLLIVTIAKAGRYLIVIALTLAWL
ncbi:YqaA family protein [Pacificitalea manganoxidans]|uniref:YqaA family protein n=1 Tax=Pacificitalea manganoxidans TaxID=1411902 RepID=UPI000B6955B3|nr:YqaA family protein [Pacificitalea manganoxidans]MDR6308246.1 membrane protein YqaA with SNARE-associated domain [Pacificitalea manganoxidans]OWU70812.1 membrane protein [Roseovarius sp. 22II1-1F6A]